MTPRFRRGRLGHLVAHDHASDIDPCDGRARRPAMRTSRPRRRSSSRAVHFDRRDEGLHVVRREVAARSRPPREGRSCQRPPGAFPKARLSRDRESPALVPRGVDREVGVSVEARKLGVGDAARQQADLASRDLGDDVPAEELIRMPAEASDADQVRNAVSDRVVDHPPPRSKGKRVVLAGLHGSDEQGVASRPGTLSTSYRSGVRPHGSPVTPPGGAGCPDSDSDSRSRSGSRPRWPEPPRRGLRDQGEIAIEQPVDRRRVARLEDRSEVIEQVDTPRPGRDARRARRASTHR